MHHKISPLIWTKDFLALETIFSFIITFLKNTFSRIFELLYPDIKKPGYSGFVGLADIG